jgi:hypothetical protein
MNDEIFDTTIWRVQETAKPGKILASLDPKNPKIGYFRSFSSDKNGHEFLAHRLGKLLGLPVAMIRLRDENIGDAGLEAGSISFLVASGASDWGQFPTDKRESLEENLDISKLLCTMAFDIWTSNTDRNSENFQYVKFQGDDKYHFFLIDHTECFQQVGNKNFAELVRIQDFQKLFKSNIDGFKPAIDKIKKLEHNIIKREIDLVPEKFLSQKRKTEIENLLITRSENLEQYIKEFCEL